MVALLHEQLDGRVFNRQAGGLAFGGGVLCFGRHGFFFKKKMNERSFLF
jgi:hypothetical protein